MVDAARIDALRTVAHRLHLAVDTAVEDLERGAPVLGERAFDLVLVFNYLHRPLLPAIVAAVAPGGLLIYETFTIEQAAAAGPRARPICWSTASCRGSSRRSPWCASAPARCSDE